MPFVQSHGASIYWKVEGQSDNPPLVLLNSIGTNMDLWAAVLPILRRHFLVLRIDTRGHGGSDAPAGDYDMTMLAGDVSAAMDAARLETGIIAGVSLGGMIAMQFALSAPERADRLVLVCTSATMDRTAWTTRVEKVRTDGVEGIADLAMSRFVSPDFCETQPYVVATIRRGLLDMQLEGYAGCAAAIRDMRLADRLGNITCPTLIVSGDRDTSTPFEGHGDHLLACIPGARHIALDAAHLAPLEAPGDVAAAIIDFSN